MDVTWLCRGMGMVGQLGPATKIGPLVPFFERMKFSFFLFQKLSCKWGKAFLGFFSMGFLGWRKGLGRIILFANDMRFRFRFYKSFLAWLIPINLISLEIFTKNRFLRLLNMNISPTPHVLVAQTRPLHETSLTNGNIKKKNENRPVRFGVFSRQISSTIQ